MGAIAVDERKASASGLPNKGEVVNRFTVAALILRFIAGNGLPSKSGWVRRICIRAEGGQREEDR